MEIVYLLIPLSLLLLGLAAYAFFWAVKHHQFQNMDTQAYRILEPDHRLPQGQGLSSPSETHGDHHNEPVGSEQQST